MRARCPRSASPPPSPSAPWGSSASSPTSRARRSGRCSPCASCSRRRCSGGSSLATGAARRLRTLPPPGHRPRPRARRRRLQRAGRAPTSPRSTRLDASLLSLLLYTFPAMVTVAAIALGRERASRRKTGALVLASGGLVLVLAGAGAGALDPLGVAARDRGRASSTRPTSSPRPASPTRVGPLAAQRAGLHRRGDDADGRHGRGRRPAPGRRDRDRLRLAGGHRGRLDGGRGQPVLRRAASASARRPPRSSRRPSR